MPTGDVLLHVLVIPAAVAGILAAIATFLPRGSLPPGRVASWSAFGAALGAAMGFVVGLWALRYRPAFPLAPSDDAWEWTIWWAFGGALAGAAETAGRLSLPLRIVRSAVLRLGLSALAAWTVLRGLHPHVLDDGALATRVVGYGLVGAAIWSALAFLARHRPLVTVLPPLAVATAGGAYLLLEIGDSAALAQGVAILGAAVAGVAVVGLVRRENPFPETLAPVVTLPYVGILAAAHGYLAYGTETRWPLETTVAMLIVPLVGLALPPSLRDRRFWLLGAAATLVGAAALLGVAAAFAPAAEPAAW